MAGLITPVAKQFLLDALVGKVPSFSSDRPTYVGLATAVPEVGQAVDLTTLTEVTTAGYARVEVTWEDANGVEPIVVANDAAVQIGPVTEDMAIAANYAFLTTAANGTNGDVLYVWPLAEAISAKAQKPVAIPAGALIIE